MIGDRGSMETLVIDPLTQRKKICRVETSNSRRRYTSDSIGEIIGFKAINRCDQTEYTGQMVYTMRPYEYIALFVNTENADDFKKVIAPSPDNGVDGAFAVIELDRESQTFEPSSNRHQIVENVRYVRTFNPPIHFSKIKIQFKTPFGHFYDFNGLNNYLLFEVRRVYDRTVIENLSQLK